MKYPLRSSNKLYVRGFDECPVKLYEYVPKRIQLKVKIKKKKKVQQMYLLKLSFYATGNRLSFDNSSLKLPKECTCAQLP